MLRDQYDEGAGRPPNLEPLPPSEDTKKPPTIAGKDLGPAVTPDSIAMAMGKRASRLTATVKPRQRIVVNHQSRFLA